MAAELDGYQGTARSGAGEAGLVILLRRFRTLLFLVAGVLCGHRPRGCSSRRVPSLGFI